MPKFVPVKDDETPALERKKESVGPVDRGWEQGNIGWGVLGSFGSSGKDVTAQMAVNTSKRSSGTKMVKNDKGLWVKAKNSDDENHKLKPGGKGRGRGGIPVFDTPTPSVNDMARNRVEDKDDYVSHSQRRREEERAATELKTSNRERERNGNRSHEMSRSRERHTYSKHYRGDHKHCRGRDDFERRRQDKRRSRSRSRSRSRLRENTEYEYCHKYRHKEMKRKRSRSKDRDKDVRKKRDIDKRKSQPTNEAEGVRLQSEIDPSVPNSPEFASFTFNSVQIVNRFLEVFAAPQNSQRILSIGDLFAIDAKVCSLKNPQKIYLEGAENIANSFLLAGPSSAVLSKRLFIDAMSSDDPVTFCVDFHRAGTSPGLGDTTKPTVLLYRCCSNKIAAVWGMVDKENICDRKDISSVEDLLKTNAWALAEPHILEDMPTFSTTGNNNMHFHDYDKIEVWG